jgi:hypothetical protein
VIGVWFLALFSIVVSGVLLALSVVPGVLEQVPTNVTLFLGGAFGVFASGTATWHLFGPARPGKPRRRGIAVVILLSLAITPLLLLTAVPRRLMFRQHQGEFEALLTQAPPAGKWAAVGLNADLNIFWIDQWGTDSRGGTYFRTVSGRDNGRAERRSFGFAFQPNDQGSPFGNERYELQHLSGDWYSFAATDER